MYSQTPAPSTSSVNTTTTSASQAPMLSNPNSKDYNASYAQLSSRYGFAGGFPTPSLASSSRSASPSSSKNASQSSKASPSPDLNRWDDAYAQLSNQYGFGSMVSAPSLPKSTRSTSSKPTVSNGQGLNRWEAAYADMSGKYGFGATVPAPSLPKKKESKAVKEDKRRFVVSFPSLSSRK